MNNEQRKLLDSFPEPECKAAPTARRKNYKRRSSIYRARQLLKSIQN